MKLRSFPKNTPLALACAALFTPLVYGQDSAPTKTLDEVVVTAIHDQSAVQVVTDPKIPRQPVPASDAADYLQTIPGFSAVRSGGTNGDPVFRGQFGSRLPLLTNGMQMLGACPGRMDTPSSYIAPETFDVLTLIKGPQTVLWGPGASAGVVRFERERPDFAAGPVNFTTSLLGASAGRNDQNADLAAGNDQFYARISANHSHGQDYKDGDGTPIPSGWDKWNADAALGWTPDTDTLVELSAGAGDGWARSAARGMDGTQFRRDSLGLRLQKQHITPWLTQLEAQIYRNTADHLMDNFQRRPLPPGKMAMASNVKRVVTGGRIAATLQPTPALTADIGLDLQRNTHEGRSGMGMSYLNKPWVRDAKFANLGLFSELRWQAAPSTLWVGGLRLDRAQAWDYRNPASTHKRDESALPSGFVRWEQTLASGPPPTLAWGMCSVFRVTGSSFRAKQATSLPPWSQKKPPSWTWVPTGRGRTGSSGPRPTPAWCATSSCSTTPATPARHATLMPAPPVSSWAAATNWHRPGRPRPRWPTPGGATAAMARPCHKCPRWKRAWAWITPKARGRRAPCGDWLPRSTATPKTRAMSWAATWGPAAVLACCRCTPATACNGS